MTKTFRTLDDVDVKGKLDGVAIRVPTPNVSVVDLKIVAKRATDVKEINAAMKRASEQQLKGILGYTTAPNVSIDFNHDPHSSTFHEDQTKVQNGTLVRVMSWYDNEWGFSNHGRHRRGDGKAAVRKPRGTAGERHDLKAGRPHPVACDGGRPAFSVLAVGQQNQARPEPEERRLA